MRRILGTIAAMPPGILAVSLFLTSTGSALERVYLAAFPALMALRLSLGKGRAPGFLLLGGALGLGSLVAWFFTASPIGDQPFLLLERLRYAELLAGVASLPLAALFAFRSRTRRVIVLFVVAILYLPVAFVALQVHRAHVHPAWSDAAGPEPRKVEIEARDGAMLRGWYVPGRTKRSPLVVLLHGIGSSRVDLVHSSRVHTARGWAVAMMDARGHGESDGMTVSFGAREKGDVAAVIEALTRGRPDTPVALQGCSLGAAVALQAAAELPSVRAVVAEAPFYDLAEMSRERTAWLPSPLGRASMAVFRAVAPLELGGTLEEVSPAAAIRRRPELRTLIIVGGRDHFIAPSHGRRLHRIAAGPSQLWEIAGAEHCGAWAAAPEDFPRRVGDTLRAAFRGAESAVRDRVPRP